MSQTITADKPRRIKPTTLAAIGFAAPLIIYMLIFYVWPLIQNISMSMHRYTRRTFVTGDAPWSGFDIYKEILGSVKPTLTYERGALIREEVQTFSLWPLLLNGYRYSKARGVHVQHQCSGCGS